MSYQKFASGCVALFLFPVFLFSIIYLVLMFYTSELNLNFGALEAMLYLVGFVFFLREPEEDSNDA